MASGAGQNRAYRTVLTLNPSSTAVATNANGTPTAYGTLGLNDSVSSGNLGNGMVEAMGFSNWTFSLVGSGSGYTVSLYGTNDPAAYKAWMSTFLPSTQSPHGAVTLPNGSWRLLPGPSEASGTGGIANPMTDTTPLFQFKGTLIAVRAVVTAVNLPSGNVSVVVEATP